MVLSEQQTREQLNVINQNLNKYLVLEKSNLGWAEDTEKFSYAIEVLNSIKLVHFINELKANLNTKDFISPDIFHKVIEAIFSEVPFTEDQLIEYYEILSKIARFGSYIIKFRQIHAHIPYGVELMLLGLSFDKQHELKDFQREKFNEDFESIYLKRENSKIDTKEFIQKAKKIFSEFI